jgi:hypothetical protein
MHLVDEGLEAVGELLLVDIPVAQAGVVGFALAEPAVVHDEAIDAQGGGLLGQGHLAGLGDVHLRGFPGVVDDGAGLGQGLRGSRLGAGQDVSQLEAMQEAGRAAQAVLGIAAIEDRGFKRLAGVQDGTEVEGIEAAGDADFVELVLLDGDAPGAAPGKCAEPDLAVVFVVAAGLDGEPGIGLVAGGAAAALDDARAGIELLLGQGPLARPAAGEVIEGVVGGG